MLYVIRLTLWGGAAIIGTVLSAGSAWSEEMPRMKLSLGYYSVIKADTYISATSRASGVGVSINPADTFGTDLEQSVVRFDGRYRFNPEHAMALTWYKISSRGMNRIDQDIDWVDSDGNEYIISGGSEATTRLSYEIIKLNYFWSFYHNDKVEIYTSAGLHGTTFKVDLEVANNIGATVDQEVQNVSSTIPLPNFGLGVEYSISRKLSWFLRSDLFSMRYNDWSGSFSDLQAGIEYQAFNYLGLGIGIGSTSLNVTDNNSDYRFSYENKISGINFYLTSEF